MNFGLNMETIECVAGVVIGIVVIVAVVNILTLPLQLMFKLIINALFGAAMLYFVNWTGIIAIKVTLIHSLIAGIFGIPGVIGLAIYSYVFK